MGNSPARALNKRKRTGVEAPAKANRTQSSNDPSKGVKSLKAVKGPRALKKRAAGSRAASPANGAGRPPAGRKSSHPPEAAGRRSTSGSVQDRLKYVYCVIQEGKP